MTRHTCDGLLYDRVGVGVGTQVNEESVPGLRWGWGRAEPGEGRLSGEAGERAVGCADR